MIMLERIANALLHSLMQSLGVAFLFSPFLLTLWVYKKGEAKERQEKSNKKKEHTPDE
ncbi:MAG: hypothetical protein FWE08_05275 [Oscillospiraceae bacterium]|nr:hypothetical protein [Oscillospiraceae bacterium]